MAARSPVRTSAGPEVMRSPTPISPATMPAREVFPSPGGPANKQVVDRLAAPARRLEDDLEVLGELRLTQELVEAPRAQADLVGQVGGVDDRVDRPVAGLRRRRRRHPGRRCPGHRDRVPGVTGPATTSRRMVIGPRPARAARRAASPRPRPRPAWCRARGGSRRGRTRARPGRPAPRCAARVARRAPAVAPRPTTSGTSSFERRSRTSRAAVLRPDPGHRGQHREVLGQHGPGRARRARATTGWPAPARGPTPWAPSRASKQRRSSAVGEAVEHDGVLADVGVDVQGHLRARHRPCRAEQRRRHRHPVADPADVEEHLAFGAPGRGACRAASRSRGRASSLHRRPATARRSGSAARWQMARARASATSGGRGGSASPSKRRHHLLDLVLGGAPVARPRPASPRWPCTGRPRSRPRPRPPGPGPLAWPGGHGRAGVGLEEHPLDGHGIGAQLLDQGPELRESARRRSGRGMVGSVASIPAGHRPRAAPCAGPRPRSRSATSRGRRRGRTCVRPYQRLRGRGGSLGDPRAQSTTAARTSSGMSKFDQTFWTSSWSSSASSSRRTWRASPSSVTGTVVGGHHGQLGRLRRHARRLERVAHGGQVGRARWSPPSGRPRRPGPRRPPRRPPP